MSGQAYVLELDWSDVVTTALLGTDRRPLPSELNERARVGSASASGDPVTVLLDAAAAHRVCAQAIADLSCCPPPATWPGVRLPDPPPAARRLLAELLARPEPALVNQWLEQCVSWGLGAPQEQWPRLADLAARSTGYDRRLLRAALGPRGVWLLQQNPRWARLVTEERSAPDAVPAGASAAPAGGSPSAIQRMLADPEAVSVAEWVGAVQRLADGSLGPSGPAVASALALAVPLTAGRVLLELLEAADLDARRPTGALGLVERSLLRLRRTIADRVQIEDAFAPPTSGPTEAAT